MTHIINYALWKIIISELYPYLFTCNPTLVVSLLNKSPCHHLDMHHKCQHETTSTNLTFSARTTLLQQNITTFQSHPTLQTPITHTKPKHATKNNRVWTQLITYLMEFLTHLLWWRNLCNLKNERHAQENKRDHFGHCNNR